MNSESGQNLPNLHLIEIKVFMMLEMIEAKFISDPNLMEAMKDRVEGKDLEVGHVNILFLPRSCLRI